MVVKRRARNLLEFARERVIERRRTSLGNQQERNRVPLFCFVFSGERENEEINKRIIWVRIKLNFPVGMHI